ncbi:Protein phosphatase 2C [Leishmania braziliensis]|nr:Protein phosphatase 2C [Leishmania braziliensis]
MISSTEVKSQEAGSATTGISAVSSPGATGAHAPGSGLTSSLRRTDVTSSSTTPSPPVENTSDIVQAEAASPSGRKQRLSFKDKQRQRTGAIGGADFVLRCMNVFPTCSSMIPRSSSSPRMSGLSPGQDRPLQQPASRTTTAAASSSLTEGGIADLEPSHRGGRSGASRPPNRAPVALTTSDALTETGTIEGRPIVPGSTGLHTSSENLSVTSKQAGSSHQRSVSLASSSTPQSSLNLPLLDTTGRAAEPPLHSPSSPEGCTSVSSTPGIMAMPINAHGTKVSIPALRTQTTSGSATTSPTGFWDRATPEELPTPSPVSPPSTSSPTLSFKNRQRAAAAMRKFVITSSSGVGALSVGSTTTTSSLPATSTAPLTTHSPSTALLERATSNAMPPVIQESSPPPGSPFLSTLSQTPTRDLAAQVECTGLASVDRSRNMSIEGGAGEPSAARSPPKQQVAKLTATRSPRPSLPPLDTVASALASHLKGCTQSEASVAATTKPQFRFFTQGWLAENEGGPSPDAMQRGVCGQARGFRDRSCSTATASTSPANAGEGDKSYVGDEEESLLTCPQSEKRVHFYNPNIQSTLVEFQTTSPCLRRNTNSSAADSQESGIAEMANSTECSDNIPRGLRRSQTSPNVLTGESEADVMQTPCPSKGARPCSQTRTESLEAATQSTGSGVASRRLPPEVPCTSSMMDSPPLELKPAPQHNVDGVPRTGPLPPHIREMRARTTSRIVDRWRQHHQPPTPQRGTRRTHDLVSSHSSLALALSTENSISSSSAQLSNAAYSRRRHRNKMLAPDGTVITIPRTGVLGGAESSGVFSPSPLGLHGRTRTVGDLAAMSVASGQRDGTTLNSPPELTSLSLRSTATLQSTVNPRLPSFRTQIVVEPSQYTDAGSADIRSSHSDLPIPLCQVPATTYLPSESSGESSSTTSAELSVHAGGLSAFSSGVSPLPTLQNTSSHISQLAKVSFAMSSVLIPGAQSPKDLSKSAPRAKADTSAGCISIDDPITYTGRRRQSVTRTGAYPSPGGGVVASTANPDDFEDSDSDYLPRNFSVMSATTAELRKLRRRSNYSSLHYGTMTGYHHRRNEQRRESRAASRKGWRLGDSGGSWSQQRPATENDSKDSTVLFSATGIATKGGASSRADKADTDDGGDSVWEQKGSVEDGTSNDEDDLLGEMTHGQWRRRSESRAKAGTAAAAASAAQEDDGDAAQRRRVGMWASVEHVFLPQYELVPEVASTVPLTVPASPHSNTNISTSAVISDAEIKQHRCSSPGSIFDKNTSATLYTTPVSDQQPSHPSPAADLHFTPMRVGSPFLRATSGSFMMPTPLTPKSSPSMYPGGNAGRSQPSGLVVLPDANYSVDTKTSAPLSCSQFRRTPAQTTGTMRLEPEDFTFGTVASAYNMDPEEEEELPQGSSDAKVAARLTFDSATGVMLMDPYDEVGRYERQGHMPPDDQGGVAAPPKHNEEGLGAKGGRDAGDDESNDGACHCDAAFIAKDFKGPDCSRYDANDLYDHCNRCHRRPAAFLCLHCLMAVCPSHVRRHHLQNPSLCTLFLNLLDIMNSFDRIFWCEKCQQFTWKHTEVYDALVDQIAFTRGTYLKQPARDIHCVGYEVRLKDVTASAAVQQPSVPVVSAETHARAHSIHVMPPAATLNQTLSTSSLPVTPQLIASSPATEALTASETCPAAARKPQSISNASVPPSGGLQLTTGADASVFDFSPESPSSGGPPLRLRQSAFSLNSPLQLPVRSPMQRYLNRDPHFSVSNAVTVGEPVTKLCALGARVQGWRTTQEDAEAVFLVDIPAISEEVVHRKELQAVAAAAEAAAKKSHETLDSGGATRRDSSLLAYDSHESNTLSISENPPQFISPLSAMDSGAHEGVCMSEEDAAVSASGAGKEEADTPPKETMPMAVFCMFDGHGGDAVAKLAARHFEAHLRRAIEGTRPDDVRARALLFFLKAETDSATATGATAPWLPPSLTAVPTCGGTLSYFAPSATSMPTLAGPAAAAATLMSSPPTSGDAASVPMPYSHLSSPFQRSSGSTTLLAPGNHSAAKRSEPNGDEASLLPKTSGVSLTLADELRNPSISGSLSLLVPVTAESLRLHVSGSAFGPAGVGVKGTSLASDGATGGVGGRNCHNTSTRADASPAASNPAGNSQSLKRNRKSGTTLDAWEAMEEPLPDMISAAVGMGSPLTAMFMSRSFTAIDDVRHGSPLIHNTNAVAGSVALCPSSAAVVSIPEMEMLRQYFASIMEDALISLDDYLRSTPEGARGDYDCVGCTACVVGITANFVLCANVGDSGAAFYTKDRMKVISVKHRVSDEAEQARIHAAGYSVINGRIEGMSAVPRALGDFDFKQCGGRDSRKQAVSAVPDVTIMPVPSDTDQWGIVLACDGVWDTATLHQVHVALTNTVNDLAVSGSAMDAVLRGSELYHNRRRGPVAVLGTSPRRLSSDSPQSEGCSLQSSGACRNSSMSPLPIKRESLTSKAGAEESMISYYDDDDGAATRLSQVDAILLTAAAGVFAQCVAPEDNDEGIGLDNCSLIIIERRNVQE